VTTDDGSLGKFIETVHDFSRAAERCFLCGRILTNEEKTIEHVVASWVQSRYDLQDETVTLLNGSGLKYRQLTVPCCWKCNHDHLAPIEERLARTVDVGREAVLDIDKSSLYFWASKLLYGLLYKELMLSSDRADPAAQTILTPAEIGRFATLRLLLQQVRGALQFDDFGSGSSVPGSLLVFSMQSMPRRSLEWDYTDDINSRFVGCRVGRVALLAVLGDGGASQTFESSYNDITSLDLHPLQFRELCAHFAYRATLATRTPKYVTIEGTPHQTIQLPLAGFSTKPLFDDWDFETYAQYLSRFTGVPLNEIWFAPSNVWTWLHGHDGKPLYLKVD